MFHDIRHIELTTIFTTGRYRALLHSLDTKTVKGGTMPTGANTRPRRTLATVAGILAALYAVTFFVGTLLHLGVWIALCPGG